MLLTFETSQEQFLLFWSWFGTLFVHNMATMVTVSRLPSEILLQAMVLLTIVMSWSNNFEPLASLENFRFKHPEIIGFISWLPGMEEQLNANQIKQAFYDAMLSTWKDGFVQAGKSSGSTTMAKLVCYFCLQESLALKKQIKNNLAQCRNSNKNKKLQLNLPNIRENGYQ